MITKTGEFLSIFHRDNAHQEDKLAKIFALQHYSHASSILLQENRFGPLPAAGFFWFFGYYCLSLITWIKLQQRQSGGESMTLLCAQHLYRMPQPCKAGEAVMGSKRGALMSV